MPKASSIDWEVARGLAAQGFGPSQIARKLGVAAGTIRSRASREGWNEIASKTLELMQQTAEDEETWRQRARTWPRRIAALMESRLRYLESKPVDRLSAREFRELMSSTDLVDEIARRSYGLDEQKSEQNHISLSYNLAEIILAEPPPSGVMPLPSSSKADS